jgi:hypothetical protein
MDEELLKMSGASAGTIAIVLVVYKILKSALGKRLISNCCGRKIEVGLDIKDSVPTPKDEVCLEIKNPIHTQNDATPIHPA